MVADEIFQSISELIERTIMDAVRMHEHDRFSARTAKGLAHNVTARICQSLQVNDGPTEEPENDIERC